MTELARLIKKGIDARLRDVHTSFPARVLRYDAALKQVDVQPEVMVEVTDESGARVLERLPVIVNVPLLFPSAGDYSVTFPVASGDEGEVVLIVVSEVSLDAWLTRGGEVDPQDRRRFHLTDAVAIPGLRPFSRPRATRTNAHMTLGKDDGPQVHIDGSKVRIMGAGDASVLEPATLGERTATALENIVAWLSSHTHAVAGGTASASLLPPPTVPDVRSTTVEVST